MNQQPRPSALKLTGVLAALCVLVLGPYVLFAVFVLEAPFISAAFWVIGACALAVVGGLAWDKVKARTAIGAWLQKSDREEQVRLRLEARVLRQRMIREALEKARVDGDVLEMQDLRHTLVWLTCDPPWESGDPPGHLDPNDATHIAFGEKVVQQFGAALQNATGLQLRREDLPFSPDVIMRALELVLDLADGRLRTKHPLMPVLPRQREALRAGLDSLRSSFNVGSDE